MEFSSKKSINTSGNIKSSNILEPISDILLEFDGMDVTAPKNEFFEVLGMMAITQVEIYEQREIYLKRYLDDLIVYWRRKRENNDPRAKFYIDAYQSLRREHFLELLVDDGRESVETMSHGDSSL